MFRYVIIFLIGFFLGHAFSGNLGLLLTRTKDLALSALNRTTDKPAERQFQVVSKSEPAPRVVQVQQSSPPPKKKRTTYSAVDTRPKPKKTAQREQLYTVQVASFKTKKQATQYVERLVSQQYDAFVAPVRSDRPADWYRVCIGETISPDQAKVLNSKLKNKFKDSFIYSF